MMKLACLISLFILLLLSGCKRGSYHQERLAKKQLFFVEEQFTPQNVPVLTSGSKLEDFVRFALLTHPTVKSSYYEWAASVQEITIARGLPNPAFVLDVNIQRAILAV